LAQKLAQEPAASNHFRHLFSIQFFTASAEPEAGWSANPTRKADVAKSCGRDMINFPNLFTHGVSEFRVFADSLSRHIW